MSTDEGVIFQPPLGPASLSLPTTVRVDLPWLFADLQQGTASSPPTR